MSTTVTTTLDSINPADPNSTDIAVTFSQVPNPNANIIQMAFTYLIPTIGPSNEVTYTSQTVILNLAAEDIMELGRNVNLMLA